MMERLMERLTDMEATMMERIMNLEAKLMGSLMDMEEKMESMLDTMVQLQRAAGGVGAGSSGSQGGGGGAVGRGQGGAQGPPGLTPSTTPPPNHPAAAPLVIPGPPPPPQPHAAVPLVIGYWPWEVIEPDGYGTITCRMCPLTGGRRKVLTDTGHGTSTGHQDREAVLVVFVCLFVLSLHFFVVWLHGTFCFRAGDVAQQPRKVPASLRLVLSPCTQCKLFCAGTSSSCTAPLYRHCHFAI